MARQTPGWSVITGQSPESHLLGTAKESAWFSRGTFSREEGSSVRRQAPESGRSGRTSCFPEAVFATNVCPASRRSVSITALAESATNPRKRFDARSLEELAAASRHEGFSFPLLVRELEESKYEVVAGARRLRAAKLANSKNFPSV